MENTLLNQELQEERAEGFKVTDLSSATWCFRKLRAIATKKAEIEETAAKEIEHIEKWKEEQLKQYESDTEFFEGAISAYFVEERAKDSKFKLSTPYGKVTSRKAKKWLYEDEEELKAYIKENDIDAIRIKEEIDKTNLKKICKDGVNQDTGELLPGVRIEETETISVKAE
jgi:actin-related protein